MPNSIRLRRGGDQYSALARIVDSGGYGAQWVCVARIFNPLFKLAQKRAFARLVKNGWATELHGAVQATANGLLALEQAS